MARTRGRPAEHNPLVCDGLEFPHALDAKIHGVRRSVSLLLEKGHPHAKRYAVSTVHLEADICSKRENRVYKTMASLFYAAGVDVVSGGKVLPETLKGMEDGE